MARVVVAGTYDAGFARNRRLLELLEASGHDVVQCHVPLWRGPRDQMSKQDLLSSMVRAVPAYLRLAWRFMRVARGDVVLVLYPGWLDVIVLAPLARRRRMPIVFDIYISLSDTVISDRQLVSTRSPVARLLRAIDRIGLRRAQRVIADSPPHADFYAELAGIPREHIGVVWVGADDAVFRPRRDVVPGERRVLFYGTFIKLHGIETIVRAAKLLEPDGIDVRIIGTGQEEENVAALLDELRPSNVERFDQVPLDKIVDEIAAATLCLGIFGTSEKARRVVPNKVFECVAVGRPVITGDTDGARSAFDDDEIAFVPPGDPAALAAEIRRMLADGADRRRRAVAARERYLEEYASDSLARALDENLAAVMARRR